MFRRNMASGFVAPFTDRLRIFFIGTILSAWLFVSDGLNFSLNWSDNSTEAWAKFLCLFTGYFFAIFTVIGCLFMLIWYRAKLGSILVMFSSLIFGSLRLVAVLLGFQDFLKDTVLDSTTSSASDIAIAAFQFYLIIDSLRMYHFAAKDEKGYIAVKGDDDDHHMDRDDEEEVEIDGMIETTAEPEAEAGTKNPFGAGQSEFGNAYDTSYQTQSDTRMSAYD